MVDKETVRQGYDEIAETYARDRSPNGEREILSDFLNRLDEADRVLDAGCGAGKPALVTLEQSQEPARPPAAIGLDFSRQQLELARDAVPDSALVQGDLSSLPIADGSVGGIVALHSIIHVPRDQHQTVIGEFARVLQPGGWLLLTEGSGEFAGSNPDWLGTGAEMQWHVAGSEQTREELRAGGFEIVEERTALDELAEEEGQWRFFCSQLSD